jgi:aminoglycoside phosphotransferase (APT) family kinase protein
LPVHLATVATWLERPAPTPQRTSLLHCDFKLNNIVLASHSLKPIALLDWDMGTLGDPLFDVATLLSYWAEPDDHPAMLALGQMPTAYPGFPTRAQVLDRYAQKSGISVREFDYYRILALFKLCVVFQQLLVRFQRGDSKDPRGATFPALIAGLIDFTAFTLSAGKP